VAPAVGKLAGGSSACLRRKEPSPSEQGSRNRPSQPPVAPLCGEIPGNVAVTAYAQLVALTARSRTQSYVALA